MNKHLIGAMGAMLATAVFCSGTAFADHRPGNVVVIGGTNSGTGHYSEPARRKLNSQKLYVDELNGRGGLLGHKVELRILDDKSDRRTAIELYDKLITEGTVDLFLGPYGSRLSDAVAHVMERYKRPFVAYAASPVIFQRGRRYVFSLPLAISQNYQKGALHLAKQIGVKQIAIIGAGEVFPRQSTEGALEWAKKLDLNVVLLESYRKEETDFIALLRRIEASGAEAIFSSSFYHDSVAQIRQLRELNINVKMFAATIGPALPKYVQELGSTAEFVLSFSSWEPKLVLGYPGMTEFIESYERRYGAKPNYHNATGYTVMQILEAAVNDAGSFDPQEVRNAMASIAVETVHGHWKPNAQGLSTGKALTIQIQNGKRMIVWPAHMAEARFLPMPKWEGRATK